MTTDKQKAANTENAKKSTGPRSKAGKTVSRRNALTHGLTGEIIFHPGESPDEYRKLRREYHQEFKPFGRYETELEILLLALRQGKRIGSVGIPTVYLDGNRLSHFRPIIDSWRIYRTLFRWQLKGG